jgi:polysaccharide deacetylase family protein (PEP-CTERM system associated)
VKAIHAGGHEIASHSWDHRRVHRHSRASFREDVRTSKDALEQLIGEPVRGFRAPTFSVMHQTGWAVDILADLELAYDSSIYPVRHDRYGVPAAPRGPFRVHGRERSILEIPPATLRLGWTNLPVGGGGYFRLLPLSLMRWSLRQVERGPRPAVAMLYFHPWEFDPDQERLPLPLVNRVRTYVGVQRSQRRLQTFLRGRAFHRADRVVEQLLQEAPELPDYVLGPGEVAEASLLDHTPDWMLTQLNDDCSPC